MTNPVPVDPAAPPRVLLPLVPLRDMVVFPRMMAPFVVGRASSIAALEEALAAPEKQIFLAAQKDPKVDEPQADDIHEMGVVAVVVQSLKLPNGHIKVMVEGVSRGLIRSVAPAAGHLAVAVEPVEARVAPSGDVAPYLQKVLAVFEQYAKLSHHLAFEGLVSSLKMDDADAFGDILAGHLPTSIPTADKQALLETVGPLERLQKLQDLLEIEIEKINIDRRINSKVKKQMERAQKEYYLNEKIKAIHQELGKKDDKTDEIEELRGKIEKAGMPKETKEKALAELKRLEAMPNVSAEATVSRNYIDWLVSVPWKKASREAKDLKRAEKILNDDHVGLEKVKERILEFLAVRQLVTETKGSILCFAGPPGVGKTSLAKSIAKSLNRKFVRLSLGGVRDEAEVRGHRRTYIGALPGRFIQNIRRAGARDPVFMLDEIDKVGADWRGDPSSALLEVLDPAQNHTFMDNYLGVSFDLSQVLFIATANTLDTIPGPLRDRMEILELSGYTDEEKVRIAEQYLIPKQRQAHGLRPEELQIDAEALRRMIRGYTREAGVRNLDRQIASVARKVARQVAEGHAAPAAVTADRVEEFLGRPRFFDEVAERTTRPGVATGLAWTPTGGDVLFVEATMIPSREEGLLLTGMLGDVMRESAQAALSFVQSNASALGVDPATLEGKRIHIHVPAGAIPKDGPSAGVTMVTAIASLGSGRPVRGDSAMTGEITLRGRVLPVGGIKEKVLAAHRLGLRRVILPRRNARDLDDVPADVRRELEFVLVDTAEEVLAQALTPAAATAAAESAR